MDTDLAKRFANRSFWTPDRCRILATLILEGKSYKQIMNGATVTLKGPLGSHDLRDILRGKFQQIFRESVGDELFRQVSAIVQEKQAVGLSKKVVPAKPEPRKPIRKIGKNIRVFQ